MRIATELANVPEGAERQSRIARIKDEIEAAKQKVLARAVSSSSAPSGTRAAASTISCAAVGTPG